MMNEVKPVRITKSSIGKRIGNSALIEQHLDKLLKTCELLDLVCESVENFQMWRVNCALRNLRENNEEPKKWRICRLAGINENCSIEVMDYITGSVSEWK
jgi:hypothetical protein